MLRRFLLLITAAIISHSLFAQQDSLIKRYSFASAYFGLSLQTLGSGSTSFKGLDERVQIPATIYPRLEIGGLHFWRKADFYISVPLAGFSIRNKDSLKTQTSTSVATGVRIYPLAIKKSSFRPFIGANWSIANYTQYSTKVTGPTLIKSKIIAEAGLSYTTSGWHLLELHGAYIPNSRWIYPTSRNSSTHIYFTDLYFTFSYKKVLDFTNNLAKPSVHEYQQALKRSMQEDRELSGFSIAAGPSSSLPVGSSDYNSSYRPFLNNLLPVALNPDLAFGYYAHRFDAEIRLSYRPVNFFHSGYGFTQQVKRKAFSLEAFKFIADYHGFVPFVGASLSLENIEINEWDYENRVTDVSTGFLTPGFVFGWDIRPSPTEWFILRTNLRYYPLLAITFADKQFSIRQVEFNFIQLVVYPQRLLARRAFNKSSN